MSLQEALNRLPQFEYQINKLESEERESHAKSSVRKNFVRQCQELHKQLDDHRKRTENTRTEETFKKNDTLERINQLRQKLSSLCPEKDQTSVSTSGESQEEKQKTEKRSVEGRRKSMMYEEDDSDEGSEIIETDVHLEEQIVPPPPAPAPAPAAVAPQPKPRQPIAITRPPNDSPTIKVMEPVVVRGNVFIALDDLEPEAEGDLPLRKGRKYRITQTRADGWWTALDENGQRGLVPKTYLQHVKEPQRVVQSKVSSRLGVRDSVIGISTTTEPSRNGEREERRAIREKECLGREFDHDPHLSLVCHLAPRLSTSNIGFHDLFWSHEKDQVFKRTVHISKIIRLVRFEKMPLIQHKALVRMALVDVTNPKATQVVSNVHTMVPRVKATTWYFEKKESNTRSCIEFSDVVLRSNYSSPTVVLVVEASHIVKTQIGIEEKSLGHTYLRLIIDDKAVPSRTNVLYLDDEIMSRMKMPEASKKRLLLQVMDVPKDKMPFVDSLPDVIVFNSLYLPFFHFYRRRAGTILIRDNRNPLSAEFVSDPLLSVFPGICDEHDIMDAMLRLWKGKKKILVKMSEAEQTAEFFQTFIHTAFFIHGSEMISYDVKDESVLFLRQDIIRPIVEALRGGAFKEFISTRKFKPINILDYSLDLLGPHSID
ncbi:unnamed protein product [Caenorhabditis sp. 36 PRJEB53466]|nr:unnamed protein product [Caenorhabditis sp. 36 PRJEB53466]